MKVHLVRVTTDDGEPQIWLAATPRQVAVDRVLEAIPKGWTASLVKRLLTMDDELAAGLKLHPGEVRQHQSS